MPLPLLHAVVVNLVSEEISEAMTKCAATLPYGESELAFAGERECGGEATGRGRGRSQGIDGGGQVSEEGGDRGGGRG